MCVANQACTFFDFWNSVIEKQKSRLKNSIRKRPFSAQESAKTQKSARGIFGLQNARVRNDLGQKKAGGGQNAGNPLGLVGGKEKKFDQKKKFFNSQVRFREI